MPFFLETQVNRQTRLGIWKITESPDDLLAELQQEGIQLEEYARFNHEERKRQWLSYRLLLKTLLKYPIAPPIVYDIYGKPHLPGSGYHLSVSHSGEFSVVIISEGSKVGVDIEKMRPNIAKLASRFLSAEEIARLAPDQIIPQLHALWCAKESIYKAYGEKGLDFISDIRVDPTNFTRQGLTKGYVRKKNTELKYSIDFQPMDGYMIAYAIECQ